MWKNKTRGHENEVNIGTLCFHWFFYFHMLQAAILYSLACYIYTII